MKCSQCSFENPGESAFCNKCGAKLQSSEATLSSTQTFYAPKLDLSIGSVFARRYQIIEELGRGGMGRVYKVLDREINEKIAIKILKPEISSDENTIERFRNELKLARKISHQNVCRMYDIVREQGLYFITMEYISGEDLKSTIMRLGHLTVGKTLLIAKQICRGLGEAHRLGVIHRDLKPHNIIIDREGEVRIMDFGIALSPRTSGVTESGALIGTPEYMSPEQAAGEELDKRSDIYSFGVIMFELVTGTVPFKGESPLDLAMKHRTESPPEPRSINPQIPKDINALILKSLEKDKRKRFSNCEEILEEISRIEKGYPTTDKIPPDPSKRWTETLPQPRRPKLLIPGISLAAAITLIVLYLLVFRGSHPPPPPPPPDPQIGFLDVTSNPSGAEIYIDKNSKGITPLSLELSPGIYEITVSYPDYEEISEELQIRVGDRVPRAYDLKPYYFVEIITDPKEAELRVDGEYQGKTPYTIQLNKSFCQISLNMGRGWAREEHEVSDLKPGKNPPQKYSLKRQQARLKINTNPPGAQVYVDGKLLGPSPQEEYVQSGSHKIRLEKEGYKPDEFPITLNANLEKTYTLARIPGGRIQPSAFPGAEVHIDNVLIGTVPPSDKNHSVEEGWHVVQFVSLDKKKTLTQRVQIKAGDWIRVHADMESGRITQKSLK